MAQVPSPEQVKQAQLDSEAEELVKTESQKAIGKDFTPTRAGVIPEEVWTERKVVS